MQVTIGSTKTCIDRFLKGKKETGCQGDMSSLCHIHVASNKLGPQLILRTLFFPSIPLGPRISFVITQEPQAHINSGYGPGLRASFLGNCIFLVKWLCRVMLQECTAKGYNSVMYFNSMNYTYSVVFVVFFFLSEISLYRFLNSEDFHTCSSIFRTLIQGS